MTGDVYPGRIILTCGLPASGKSTFARSEASKDDRWIIFEIDGLRRTLSNVQYTELSEGFILSSVMLCAKTLVDQHKWVVIDDCHPTVESRKKWIDFCKEHNMLIECRYINTAGPFEYNVCLTRNSLRENPIPDEVMEEMNDKFVSPGEDEGFNAMRSIGEDTNAF